MKMIIHSYSLFLRCWTSDTADRDSAVLHVTGCEVYSLSAKIAFQMVKEIMFL